MVTIYDVAKLAGVSPATVSRVYNGVAVREANREQVLAAAGQLGFSPNPNAQRLRTQSSSLIAMVIPDIENPYFMTLTGAVEDAARAQGLSLMLANSGDQPGREAGLLHAMAAERVAGVVIAPSGVDTPLDILLDRSIPVVCVDRTAPNFPVDCVVIDNRTAARDATRELIGAGHRHIACITGPVGVETAEQRREGWLEALDEAGLDRPESSCLRSAYAVEGGEAAMRELLERDTPLDAVLAANNKIAVGALRVLLSHGPDVPPISVASIGELPIVPWLPQGVRTTHLPAWEIGATAAELLIERLAGSTAPPRTVVIPSAAEPAA